MSKVETDINKRWENGTPHHPKSEELFSSLADIDYQYGDDSFCWKCGGDGDNGENLMYHMDIHFEREDEIEKSKAQTEPMVSLNEVLELLLAQRAIALSGEVAQGNWISLDVMLHELQQKYGPQA